MTALEAEARRAARGLWAGGFTRPEEWRRRN
jgi:endonuclease YncB( thermonuclease family)